MEYKSIFSCSFYLAPPSKGYFHRLYGFYNSFFICNVVIEYICNCHVFREANLNSPCTKAFMNDLILKTSSVVSTELLLQRCTFVLSWARMSFRASKSRSIVIQNYRVLDVSPFSFDNEAIPSIYSNPVRFLGRSIDVSL